MKNGQTAASNPRKKFLVLFLAIILVWVFAASGQSPVQFTDEHLKASVEKALTKDNPTPSDMLSLQSISIRETITSLEGLQYAHNLNRLSMKDNLAKDFELLSEMKSLTHLDLQGTSIVDASGLSNLKSLEFLNLDNNKIADISALSDLRNIEVLYLSKNQISDIGALSEMTKLKYLHANLNRIKDFSALAKMTSLEEVQLINNRIEKIPDISALTKLHILELSHNSIHDISGLAGLRNLTRLGLELNPLNSKAYTKYIPLIKQRNKQLNAPELEWYFHWRWGFVPWMSRRYVIIWSSQAGPSFTYDP
ncbi:MAG: leucine-rich repeat domain-containing protein, partial [Planctomycetota bacterium]